MPNKPRTFRPAGRQGRGRRPLPRKTDARGYGRDWQALRAAHVAAHPLCVMCEREGRAVVGTQVDHVVPFRGKDDPLRLEPSNLRTLCDLHHNQVTHGADKGQRR